MNEKNFDSISQFEVPKSWIDDALSIPQNKVKKPFPLIKFSRNLMAVACFILVCGISIALYFITNDSSIPPVKSPVSSQSVNTEILTEGSNKNESDIRNSENKDKDEQTHSATQSPSIQSSHPERSEDETVVSTQAHKKPADKPNKKPEQNNQDNPIQTDALEPPEEKPTQGEDDKPVDPNPPVEIPSEVILPTEPPAPTEDPTEPPAPTDETIFVPPWVTPTIKPTTPNDPYFDNFVISSLIAENKVASVYTIYCAVYDASGRILGKTYMIDSSHIAIKGETSGGKTEVYYYPYRHFDVTKSGTYTYKFYDSRGNILASNTCYLKSNS